MSYLQYVSSSNLQMSPAWIQQSLTGIQLRFISAKPGLLKAALTVDKRHVNNHNVGCLLVSFLPSNTEVMTARRPYMEVSY